MKGGFNFLFILLLLLCILGVEFHEFEWLHLASKPMLMGSLLILTLSKAAGANKRILIPLVIAIVLSLIGDVLLTPIFEHRFFVFGLASFLVAHIAYILCFIYTPKRPLEVPVVRKHPWLMLLLMFYGAWMYLQVKYQAGEIAWAVLIYIAVICIMAITAFNRYGAVSIISFQLVTLGALCFLASDSILAWNRFVMEVPNSHWWVLSTYGIAQLLIVHGLIRQMHAIEDT